MAASIRSRAARSLPRRSVVSTLAVVAVLAALAAPVALAAEQSGDISGNAFSPGTITATVGDTVTWANADARSHTATADDGTWDTGTIAGNSTGSITASAVGTFPYHCRIHPDMKATLIVKAAATATAPPTDAAASRGALAPGLGAWLLLAAAVAGIAAGLRRFAGRVTR
jgi:plastocyanin